MADGSEGTDSRCGFGDDGGVGWRDGCSRFRDSCDGAADDGDDGDFASCNCGDQLNAALTLTGVTLVKIKLFKRLGCVTGGLAATAASAPQLFYYSRAV